MVIWIVVQYSGGGIIALRRPFPFDHTRHQQANRWIAYPTAPVLVQAQNFPVHSDTVKPCPPNTKYRTAGKWLYTLWTLEDCFCEGSICCTVAQVYRLRLRTSDLGLCPQSAMLSEVQLARNISPAITTPTFKASNIARTS